MSFHSSTTITLFNIQLRLYFTVTFLVVRVFLFSVCFSTSLQIGGVLRFSVSGCSTNYSFNVVCKALPCPWILCRQSSVSVACPLSLLVAVTCFRCLQIHWNALSWISFGQTMSHSTFFHPFAIRLERFTRDASMDKAERRLTLHLYIVRIQFFLSMVLVLAEQQ